MFQLPKEIIIFDTEFTTWEGAQERKWSGPNEYREIVEIGSILVDTTTLKEKGNQLLLVRPVKNPILSEYFITLTDISQKEVDEKGTPLADALKELGRFGGGREFYCFGSDGKVIIENCALIGVPCPLPPERFHNIKELFQREGMDTAGYMSSTIVRAFGTEPTRHAHDGLSDARSILDALRLLADQKRPAH